MSNHTFEFDETIEQGAIIYIVGVGKTGLRAVGKMAGRIHNVECIGVPFADIDASIPNSLPIVNLFRPDLDGALNLEPLIKILETSDLVFLVSHLNEEVPDSLLLNICTATCKRSVTLILVAPEPLDGKGRPIKLPKQTATLRAAVDGVILVSKDSIIPLDLNAPQVFDEITMHDYLIRHAIEKVTDLITTKSPMCMDFADVQIIIKGDGVIRCGTGIAMGADRGVSATEKAGNALRQQGIDSLKNCPRLLCCISGSGEMTMEDYNNVNRSIYCAANGDADIKIGMCRSDEMGNNLMVTIWAVENE